MGLSDITVSKAIVENYFQKLLRNIEVDVAIVGGGPSGLVAGYFLAKAGRSVAMFERKLSIGGGMWGGGMMFNEIVVQDDATGLLDEFGIDYLKYSEGYNTAGSVESASCLVYRAAQAGVSIFNCMDAEDVMIRNGLVCGLVINWSPVTMSGLHIDPISISARAVIDATGHDTEVVKVVQKKVPGKLNTPSGSIEGEKYMHAELAEELTLSNTGEVFPGLYVTGMAANAVHGGPRMGPIFGGMLLSGEKVAGIIDTVLDK